MHHTCQTPICSDGTVNDHQGRNCDPLTKVVDAHAAELARHTDNVKTLQRTLEPRELTITWAVFRELNSTHSSGSDITNGHSENGR